MPIADEAQVFAKVKCFAPRRSFRAHAPLAWVTEGLFPLKKLLLNVVAPLLATFDFGFDVSRGSCLIKNLT
jgi:hypothetical protein